MPTTSSDRTPIIDDMVTSDDDGLEFFDKILSLANEVHTPNCDDDLKPYLGKSFDNFEEGVAFYKIYGEACGFDVRRGTITRYRDGSITRMLLYCNRQRIKHSVSDDVNPSDTKQKRRRGFTRTGCMARIALKFDALQCCVVDHFEEKHSHPLVSNELKKCLKVERNLGYVRENIDPTKSYSLFKDFVGDYSDVGFPRNHWKIYDVNLRAYIKGCDANMMLEKMFLKKETCDAFYFDYTVDKTGKLRNIFWADPIARRNYSVFGDVVSFDCTYSTNRYELIFALFNGKDNHGKIVTFAAALLSREDNTIYTWVFQKFKECMERQPSLIITDQDPAKKIALECVFPESVHRLCMRHIMMEVPSKIPAHLKENDEFIKQLNALVRSDMIGIHQFEQQWEDIMVEYELSDDKWFSDLFDIRRFWIPAYFRDLPMSGICRTTPISESVNRFFDHYLRKGSNLEDFLTQFERAMDAQRQTNDILNSLNSFAEPLLKTPLQIEKHAASIYTMKMFIKVQEEILDSCFHCRWVSMKETDEGALYEVNDGSDDNFSVQYKRADDSIVCSCNKFVIDGILCCHIFLIFKNMNFVRIPDKYIVPRWTKAAHSKPLHDIGGLSLDGCVDLDENKRMINNLISLLYACVDVADGDEKKMKTLVGGLTDLKDVLSSGDIKSSWSSWKSSLFDSFYGMPESDGVHVHPPLQVETKGSGSHLKSRNETAVERAEKPPRMCRKCNTLSHHDSRNCKS